MSQEGRQKEAERLRKRARVGKTTVVILAAVTAAMWGWLFIQT